MVAAPWGNDVVSGLSGSPARALIPMSRVWRQPTRESYFVGAGP